MAPVDRKKLGEASSLLFLKIYYLPERLDRDVSALSLDDMLKLCSEKEVEPYIQYIKKFNPKIEQKTIEKSSVRFAVRYADGYRENVFVKRQDAK